MIFDTYNNTLTKGYNMKKSIDTASAFRDEFHKIGRGDQFSYEGLRVLFNFLEDIDPEFELDVIALCCDYTESTVEDALKNYGYDNLTQLEESTCVLKVSEDVIIYQGF
jgi:hypothetical protein